MGMVEREKVEGGKAGTGMTPYIYRTVFVKNNFIKMSKETK